jgi:ornithine--oxo-acid transaminase
VFVPRIVVPPEGYLRGVAELCKKHNVLLICDEIQTVRLLTLCMLYKSLISLFSVRVYVERERCSRASMITSDQTLSFWAKLFQGAVSGSSCIYLTKSDDPIVYPVSAVLADKSVMLCIKPGEHGSTYGGYVLLASYTILS